MTRLNSLCHVVVVAAVLIYSPCPTFGQENQPHGDVFDQFFRYTEPENRAQFQELPGETVDPFTGTLTIVRKDLVLPGKAGLDLVIMRTYGSKIWGRSDFLDYTDSLLAEKERSVLGYGWSFHMGRLKNPYATGESGFCSGDFPVLEGPDGSARVFYPVDRQAQPGVFVSKDFWLLETQCSQLGGAGACVWSDGGVRYEFSNAPGNPFFVGTSPVWPLTRIEDLHGNDITVEYRAGSGAFSRIIDSYGREVSFAYKCDGQPAGPTCSTAEGLRLDTMTANGKTYTYLFTQYVALQERRFLTEVRPPEGPSEFYDYAIDKPVADNRYALSRITYPTGGSTSYVYESRPFYTGWDEVSFPVVVERTVETGELSALWSYDYVSPGPGSEQHVTTITRPDGMRDVYTLVGFGFIAGQSREDKQYVYAAGVPIEVSTADGLHVEHYGWQPSANRVSPAFHTAPSYSSNGCSISLNFAYHEGIRLALMNAKVILRDGAIFATEYSDFDEYGQARLVTETGAQGSFLGIPPSPTRSTVFTFFSDPAKNILRGRPDTQVVTVDGEVLVNSWTYDARGQKESETLSGVTTTFGYDGQGRLERVTNARNVSVEFHDYKYGVPTRVQVPDALTIYRGATWEGQIAWQKDGRGNTTYYTYDAIGRIKTVTPPPPNDLTEYEYSPTASWVKMTKGSYWRQTNLDGLGREVSALDSENVASDTWYDTMGRVWFRSYPRTATTTPPSPVRGIKSELDGLGRARARLNGYDPAEDECDRPDACRVSLAHYANCEGLTTERGLDDSTVAWTCYSSFGDVAERRIRQVNLVAVGVWQYDYNVAGKLVRVTAPLPQGNRSYEYDENQFLRVAHTGETGTLTYGRNAVGQMTSRSDGRPVTATFHYDDPAGRLRYVTYGGVSDEDVVQRYDAANNVEYIQSQRGGAFDFGYDKLNRLTSETWTYAGRTYTTTYDYDPSGCLWRTTYPTGTSVTATCDALGRPASIHVGNASAATSIKYHPTGAVSSYTQGNGLVAKMTYDSRGRMQGIQALRTPSLAVFDLELGYDGADNLVYFNDRLRPSRARVLTYDKLDRLESVTVATGELWGEVDYAYDALGNRTRKSYNADAPTDYIYDETTNRLARVTGPVDLPAVSLSWSLAGTLASTSDGATYAFDARGRRVRKTVGATDTLYHYDHLGRVIAETRGDGSKLRDYVYLGGRLLVMDACPGVSTNACQEWYQTDHLGSVVGRTDGNGDPVVTFEYAPWGEVFSTDGAGDAGSRQYNGRVYDPGTGFHDYGARMYWPEIGRFVSADSYPGDIANPASLNRYSYVLNNPYKYVDPSGNNPALVMYAERFATWCQSGGCAAVGAALVAAGAAVTSWFVIDRAVEDYETQRAFDLMSASSAQIGDVVSGPEVMQAKSLQEQAADLVPLNNGRSRVTLDSPSQRMEVDLTGKPHAGVPTPHTKASERNTRAPESVQPAYNTKKAETKPATQEDIRTVRRALERRQ